MAKVKTTNDTDTKGINDDQESTDPVDGPKKLSSEVDGTNVANSPDPFDPASLRLGQDFASAVGVRKVITTVPCRKPHKQEFVRVRPGEDWRLETAAFEDQVSRDTYLIERSLWTELSGQIYPICLFTTINRQGDLFLWPVKLPATDGRRNAWHDSALEAAKLAESGWTRVEAKMNAGHYETYEAIGQLSEPSWPEVEFPELLKLSFRDRFIEELRHPLLRSLRGEA